ncbi:MAG: hypothetical protein LM550_10805 [Candidatus Contendobacter sp.]|jgi:CRISPR-associated endonuclease Cas2|nr:hypothetical protein [Gammaproteobacteria bacterium]MCC8994153.1 hypothetical protein [Candidatus Contendobacter sp.]
MMYTITGTRPSRLVVLSYDISCPRRSRRVRRVLDAVHHAKQYSVFEALLSDGEFRSVLAEISACCDFSKDLLATWWPLDGLRLGWQNGQLTVIAHAGQQCRETATLRPNIGNFIICYDISDTAALRAVASEVAAETAMVQRSVYWLRAPKAQLSALFERCASHLTEGDCLWAYPLASCQALSRAGTQVSSILPIATHRWRSS